MRRKDFWLLSAVEKVLKGFIPSLSHEADGLIFQVTMRLKRIFDVKAYFSYKGSEVLVLVQCILSSKYISEI